MTWAKLDDQFHAHRKAKVAWKGHPRALGLHLLAMSYCAGQLTDGFVDEEFVEEKLPLVKDRTAAVNALIDAGLWGATDGGWNINDWLEYNPSKAAVEREREWDRRRKELFRDPELVATIRRRDSNRCRYCGTLVNWKDRRGSTGGTYDHVIPRGPNTLENVVVACRRCNLAKGAKTPETAGMPLLDPGQMGSSSEAGSGQNGASSGAKSVQVTRPDPTRPDPDKPPQPPAGGRARSVHSWREQVIAWSRSIGVDGADETLLRALEQSKPWQRNGDAGGQFRSFVGEYFPDTLTVEASA